MADSVGIAIALAVEKFDQRGWQEGDGGGKGGGRVVSSRGKWILLEGDGLPARGKILDKSYLCICTGDK